MDAPAVELSLAQWAGMTVVLVVAGKLVQTGTNVALQQVPKILRGVGGRSSSPKRRIVWLDILRLAAVLLVLGRHAPDAPSGSACKEAFDAWKCGGWVGVDLFFVLSGFLVSGLLFHEYDKRGSISFGRFFLRRGGKIWPPFFAFIAATIAVKWGTGRPIELERAASELAFCQSYFPAMWPHTWSLAVEEHFYIALPLLLMLIIAIRRESRHPLSVVPLIAAIVGVLCLALRLSSSEPFSYRPHLFASHLRADALMFGVAIAYFWHYHRARCEILKPYRHSLIAIGMLAMAPPFFYDLEANRWMYTAGLTLFYLGAGPILLGVVLLDQPNGKAIARLSTLGVISYSVYLWHMAAVSWCAPPIARALRLSYESQFAVYVAGSFAIGAIAYWVVEKPAMRLRDRLIE